MAVCALLWSPRVYIRAVAQFAFSVSHPDRGQLTSAGPQGASPRPQETEHGPATGVHTCVARAPGPALPNGDVVPSPGGWGSSCGDKQQAGALGFPLPNPGAPVPISSGQRSGRQHPGGRHSRLFLPGRLASGPMPSPHGRCGLCVGVRGPCGAGLRAGLSWIGPAVPKPQGNRAGQPLRLEASAPSLKPPDARQESGSVSLHSRELETFQQAPGPLGPLTSGRRLPEGPELCFCLCLDCGSHNPLGEQSSPSGWEATGTSPPRSPSHPHAHSRGPRLEDKRSPYRARGQVACPWSRAQLSLVPPGRPPPAHTSHSVWPGLLHRPTSRRLTPPT